MLVLRVVGCRSHHLGPLLPPIEVIAFVFVAHLTLLVILYELLSTLVALNLDL